MTARERLCLGAIVVLAAVLRLAALGSIPPGLHPDEAASAHEACCLAKTGRSSDGRPWPLVFRVTDNWIEGTYIYVELPFVTVLDDRIDLAARVPAAIAGTLAVLATFALGRRLGEKSGGRSREDDGVRTGLLAAALLAVEPWAVHHSRVGLSPPLLTFLVPAGLALVLSGLEREERDGLGRAIVGGCVLAFAAAFVYTPARVFVPALVLALVLLVPGTRRTKLAIVVPIVLALAAIAPFALSEEGIRHAREVAVTSFQAFKNYFKYFSPRALVFGEVDQGFWARGVPPLHGFEPVLAILGAAACFRGGRVRQLLIVWLGLYPVAAAMGAHSPNMMRAIFAVPLFALLGGIGLSLFLDRLARKPVHMRRAAIAVSCLLAIAALGRSAWLYATEFPVSSRNAWAPYRGERERVEAMRGTVEITLPYERALVDLYARNRPHTWIVEGGKTRVRFD